MVIFFTVFFLLYSTVNFYIFIRGLQGLSFYPAVKPYYIIIFLISSLSYLAAKVFYSYLPSFLYDTLLWIGSFWFAYILYLILFLLLIDLSRLLNHFFEIYPSRLFVNYPKTKFIAFVIVFGISSLIILGGFINKQTIRIKDLVLEIPRKQSALTELNIVMLSDIHISTVDNESYLTKVVQKVNALNPDLILIPGDLVDEKAELLKDKGIGNAFKNLKAKYGVYASTGNHEYINEAESSIEYLKSFNIKWLRDEYAVIAESFNLIGREDRSITQFVRKKRKPLQMIVNDINPNLPTILMDHTPLELSDASSNGIDLQISGHTHHGQLYPLNFITTMIYEVSWGYLKKGNTQYYISSGVGTWGPPVKTGSSSEIVNIKLIFM